MRTENPTHPTVSPTLPLSTRPQAINVAIEKRDNGASRAARSSAYQKLTPLVWRQLLQQSEALRGFVDALMMMDLSGSTSSVMTIRAEEQINGRLQLRMGDRQDEESPWQESFCAISKNLFLVYREESSTTPDEIICLQFATISANRDWSHAFNISTPVVRLELRAADESSVEKWTDTIFALQCSDSFQDLVPRGMRKHHFLRRLIHGLRGGEMAVRLLKRASAGRRETTVDYEAVHPQVKTSGDEPAVTDPRDADGVELTEMLKDPKLGKLLRAFADEHGASADLQLYCKVNETIGSDVEILEKQQMDSLPQTEKRNLLRLSSLIQQSGDSQPTRAADSDASAIMQEAYDLASRRLMGELLPRFCETDDFKRWLAQQQEDEFSELQLIAMMQSPPGFSSLTDHVSEKPEEHVLAAAVRIYDLLASTTEDNPGLQLAQQIFDEHFTTGPMAIATANSSLVHELKSNMRAWARDHTDSAKRQNVMSAFQTILADDLRVRLLPILASIKTEPSFESIVKSMCAREQSKNSLLHWLHIPQAFDVLRDWMAEQRAVENVDFIADVINFKKLEDVSLTKENASRIYNKFITTGSLAQICLPSAMARQIQQGLQPRFPSYQLFDDAVEHVTQFLQQDMWNMFMESSEYATHGPTIHATLNLGGLSPPLLLSVKWVGGGVRHTIILSKRVLTIGASTRNDVVIPAAGAHSSILQVDPKSGAGTGAHVSMLWSAAPCFSRTLRGSIRNSSTSLSIPEHSRSSVITRHAPRFVRLGESFLIGDFEAMLLSFGR
jgi:hypothetical protein